MRKIKKALSLALAGVLAITGLVNPTAAKADNIVWSSTDKDFSKLMLTLADGSSVPVTDIRNTSFGKYKLNGIFLTIDNQRSYAVKEQEFSSDNLYHFTYGHALKKTGTTYNNLSDEVAAFGSLAPLQTGDKFTLINANNQLAYNSNLSNLIGTTNYTLGVKTWESGSATPSTSYIITSANFANPDAIAKVSDTNNATALAYQQAISSNQEIVIPDNENAELVIYKAKSIQVDYNGGTGSSTNAYLYRTNPFSGNSYVLDVSIPTRTGYTFGGWSSTNTTPDKGSFDPSADKIYATWWKGSHLIDSKAPTTDSGKQSYSVVVTSGGSIIVKNKDTKTKASVKGAVFKKGNLEYKVTGKTKVSVTKAKKMTRSVKLSTVTYKGSLYKVTSVGKNAFKGCKNLRSVVLGEYVKSVGTKSFYGCKNLKKVKIQTPYCSIGKQSFAQCKKSCKVSGTKWIAKKIKKQIKVGK